MTPPPRETSPLDPTAPWLVQCGKGKGPQVNVNYRKHETTTGLNHADIIDLYRAGMAKAVRVLKAEGLLRVKCQDESEASRQC